MRKKKEARDMYMYGNGYDPEREPMVRRMNMLAGRDVFSSPQPSGDEGGYGEYDPDEEAWKDNIESSRY